jgi:hypothetical protein
MHSSDGHDVVELRYLTGMTATWRSLRLTEWYRAHGLSKNHTCIGLAQPRIQTAVHHAMACCDQTVLIRVLSATTANAHQLHDQLE